MVFFIGKEVYLIYGSSVLIFNNRIEMSNFVLCIYEEVDICLMIYVFDVLLRGCWCIKIRINDIDVIFFIFLVVSIFFVDEFWIIDGVGKNVGYMFVYVVVLFLSFFKVFMLLMFYVLIGFDIVLFFCNCGRKFVWDVWNVFFELILVLCVLKVLLEIIMEELFVVLERFVVFFYD